jgi:small-conductance mechanosensitive channel
VKLRFDAEGVTIPFPQRDVHVYASADADWNRQLGGGPESRRGDQAPEQNTSAARPIESDTSDESG